MDERRFLVIVPTGRLRRVAMAIQGEISRRYGLYGGFPPPVHVTIEHFTPAGASERQRAIDTIRGVADGTAPFELKVDGFSAFPSPVRAFNLRVVETSPLRSLSKRMHEALRARGIPVRESLAEWEFHLTLASTTFAERPWSDEEFAEAYRFAVRRHTARARCRVEELQLWAPEFNPNPAVGARFPLQRRPSLSRRDPRSDAPGAGLRRR